MRTKFRGIRDIPSVVKLKRLGQVRARCEYETLNELARLSREKTWLNKEKENWQERIDRIDARLREIEELERSLHQRMAVEEKINTDAQGAMQVADKEKHEVTIKY